LKGKGLKEAGGQNPNQFYELPVTGKPLIHSEISASSLTRRKVYDYDLLTRKGDIIEISK